MERRWHCCCSCRHGHRTQPNNLPPLLLFPPPPPPPPSSPPAGDWLQGPYVYHLYEHYGFSVRDIGRLFIAGFGSSAVLGTVVGALADKQ